VTAIQIKEEDYMPEELEMIMLAPDTSSKAVFGIDDLHHSILGLNFTK